MNHSIHKKLAIVLMAELIALGPSISAMGREEGGSASGLQAADHSLLVAPALRSAMNRNRSFAYSPFASSYEDPVEKESCLASYYQLKRERRQEASASLVQAIQKAKCPQQVTSESCDPLQSLHSLLEAMRENGYSLTLSACWSIAVLSRAVTLNPKIDHNCLKSLTLTAAVSWFISKMLVLPAVKELATYLLQTVVQTKAETRDEHTGVLCIACILLRVLGVTEEVVALLLPTVNALNAFGFKVADREQADFCSAMDELLTKLQEFQRTHDQNARLSDLREALIALKQAQLEST